MLDLNLRSVWIYALLVIIKTQVVMFLLGSKKSVCQIS